jgi:hypothetical protein
MVPTRILFPFATLLALGLAACGSKNMPLDGDGGVVDAGIVCATFGQSCAGDGDCCSMTCDQTTNTCAANPTMCSPASSSCSAGTDCCSGKCVGNVCSADQCTADDDACTGDGQCCSGMCSASGTCTPLNDTCKTTGNPCGAGGDCCSGLCGSSGFCAEGSFCTQSGDACAHDSECCGGICNLAAGGIGTCSQPSPGSTLCSAGIDGTLCSGCGDCCSRLCAPYGPTGVTVCQPAEGCRINGDLCHDDSDCCGGAGSGLPGDGNVQCLRENPTDPVGICRNPMSCNPEGDVCHYQNYGNSCGNSSARNDCCGAVGNSGVCQLDPLGVPRCFGLGTSCQQVGDTCAFSGDCCDGAPCVPDDNGVLRCGASQCVPQGGNCSSTADCCNGQTCTMPPGSIQGTCGGSDSCALLGQDCSDANPCCTGFSCNVAGSDPVTACPTGQTTGCVCQVVVN